MIYPDELDLKHENAKHDKQASYLDLNINVVNMELVTSIYDKRDDFPFKIVNFVNIKISFNDLNVLSNNLCNKILTKKYHQKNEKMGSNLT